MIRTYRSCAALGVCQGDGRCADCDFGPATATTVGPALRPWPPRYPFAPGVIDGLPNADALSPRARVQAALGKAAFVLSALLVGCMVAGYLTGYLTGWPAV